MSDQTARLVARLRRRLRRTARRMTWAEVAFGGAVALGAAAAAWLLAALFEASLWLGPGVRTAVVGGIALSVGAVAAVVLARPLGRALGLLPGRSAEDVARTVGSHYPDIDDRLVNLLQLAEGKRSHAPAPLVDRAVQDLADDLDAVSFDEVEDFGRARRAVRFASLPLLGLAAFLLAAPSTFMGASSRLLAPTASFERPAPFELSVTPGDTRLVKGDTLRISGQATGQVPATATLLLRDTAGTTRRVELRPDAQGRFRHVLPNVRRPLRYRMAAGTVRTDWHGVAVAARPLVRRLQLTVRPPAYTGKTARQLDPNVGDVAALPGARVTVTAALGGPTVETAALVFEEGRADTLSVTDGTAETTFTLRREGSYHLRLRTATGVTNRAPIEYQTTLRTDARPSVSFERPDTPSALEADLVQPLRLRLRDDFGVRRLALYYRLADGPNGGKEASFSSTPIPLSGDAPTAETIRYEWLLAQESGLDPEPGEAVEYYVRVWDNDTVNGPKSGRTRTQRLRRPSLTEQVDQINETEQAARQRLDSLRQQSDALGREFERLRRDVRRTREADWQNQRQLQRLQQRQESMQQGAQSLSRTMQKMTRQMQKSGLSSPQTRRQFRELKRIMDQMEGANLRDALEQLKQALSQDDPRRMQNALEQVQQRQQQYQQRLRRTQKLLERLQAQQQLEELAKQAGELSNLQEKLRRETRRLADSSRARPDARRPSPDSTSRPSASDSTSRPSPPDSTRGQRRSSASGRDSTQASSAGPQPDSTRRSSPPRRSPTDSMSAQQRSGADDLAREQEQAAERMEALMEQMQQAQQRMQNAPSAPKRQMRRMNKQMRQENLPRKMRQNSRKLRQNRLQDARQGQQRMQQRLQQMQQQFNKMQSGMQGRRRSMNVAGLRTALENVLRLSEQQEALRSAVTQLHSSGPALRPYARDQKALASGLQTVADSLQSIASRVPRMSQAVQEESGRALRAMESAVTALDERNAGPAAGHQKTSMTQLNELALLLSNLLDKLQRPQGSGGGMSAQQMMKQLQQMSGQQQKLNRQIQQHLNETQGERLSPGEGQRRKELAKQQRRLSEQLQNLNQEAGSEAQQQVMGDLDKIAEQMEQSAQSLERREQRRELMKRQEQILTRLLNAQKSLRTQGKKDQRQGQAAEDPGSRPRPPQSLPDDSDTLRRDLIRALEMGYTPDYESLIRRYFELLREERSGPPPSDEAEP